MQINQLSVSQDLDKGPEAVAGALVALYNALKFFPRHQAFLSSITEYYLDFNKLSTRQETVAVDILKRDYLCVLTDLEWTATKPKKVIRNRNKIKLTGNKLELKFPFNKSMIDEMKSLGGQWNPTKKTWTIFNSCNNLIKFVDRGFSPMDKFTKKTYQSRLTKTQPTQIADIDQFEFNKLYDYQKTGVGFLESTGGNCIIGDEMGLGKTIQALAWLQMHHQTRPVIVVCPATLKLNWKREIFRWLDNPTVTILQGFPDKISQKQFLSGNHDIVIINYDILADRKSGNKTLDGWSNILKKLKPQIVIADEIHYCKNPSSNRTKAFMSLAKDVPHKIGLSGTPITSRPVEFFTTLHMIDPVFYPSFWQYKQRYCNPHHNGFGWSFKGITNGTELHERVTSHNMVRRLKKDVLTQLPAIQRSCVPFELTQEHQADYNYAKNNFISWLKEIDSEKTQSAKNAEALVKIERLKQIAVAGKLDSCISWIEDFLSSDEKLVVFCTHRSTIQTICDTFPDISVRLEGGMSQTQKQSSIDNFQENPKIKLFVGNVKAGGVGITLTASSNVAFVEFPWTPADIDQAEARCHRIGQNDSVNVYYLVAEDTIDETMIELLDKKRKIVDEVLDGTPSTQTTLFEELLKSLKS